jgi:hypothetical protein
VKKSQFDNQMTENVEMRSKFKLSKIYENKFDTPGSSGESKFKNLTQSGVSPNFTPKYFYRALGHQSLRFLDVARPRSVGKKRAPGDRPNVYLTKPSNQNTSKRKRSLTKTKIYWSSQKKSPSNRKG